MNQPKKKKGFLAKIHLTGAAGVDSPAHQHPGWIVLKSEDDDLAQAINESLAPVVQELRRERTEVQELSQLIAANQLALDDLTAQLEGRLEKSEGDLRTKAGKLADDVRRVQDWMGGDVRTSISKAENMDAVEASKLFWGIA